MKHTPHHRAVTARPAYSVRPGRVGAGIIIALVLLLIAAAAIAAVLRKQGSGPAETIAAPERGAVPVEVAPIERGSIERRRVFSGGLEPTAIVDIAPRVAGRIVSLPVDLSDRVTRGQVIAELDREEFEQAVTQAEAELAVRNAALVGAESSAEIARREFERTSSLHKQAVVSDSDLDLARANDQARRADLEMARAQVTVAESNLRTARIRLSYATVRADWSVGDDTRVIARRYAEEGATVSPGSPIVSVVEISPITAVIFATEEDYPSLDAGQPITLRTNAYPDRTWQGEVARVAPVFREGSRQARIELDIPNDEGLLKPGMFVRAEAVLGRADGAMIVPAEALTLRDGRTILFIVDGSGSGAVSGEEPTPVRVVPVETGIRDRGRVQVLGEGLDGYVVTLGQQLLNEGSEVTFESPESGPETGPGESPGAAPEDADERAPAGDVADVVDRGGDAGAASEGGGG